MKHKQRGQRVDSPSREHIGRCPYVSGDGRERRSLVIMTTSRFTVLSLEYSRAYSKGTHSKDKVGRRTREVVDDVDDVDWNSRGREENGDDGALLR